MRRRRRPTSKCKTIAASRTPPAKVRMREIADHAGVTAMTVSRALRTPALVSVETMSRIKSAIDELGFVPNYAAGSLASRRSRIVVVIVPTLANSVFADFIEELSATLNEGGYTAIVGCSNYDHGYQEKLLASFLGWRPAGIILTGSFHTRRTRELCERAGAPIIETWSYTRKPLDTVIGFSNRQAIYEMTKAMIAWGHRNIGFGFVESAKNDRTTERRRGWEQAMREAGYDPDPKSCEGGSFSMSAGAHMVDAILSRNPDTTAIVFGSDTLAIGALMECRRRGIRVPEDLAISGFGDVELAAEVVPALTTVRTPRRELGRLCAEVMIKRIEGTYTGPRMIDCGFEIVRRQSA